MQKKIVLNNNNKNNNELIDNSIEIMNNSKAIYDVTSTYTATQNQSNISMKVGMLPTTKYQTTDHYNSSMLHYKAQSSIETIKIFRWIVGIYRNI